MIEVILHLFFLVPLFTYIKHLPNTPASKRFTYAMLAFSVVSIIQVSSYLGQGNQPFLKNE